MGKIMMRMVMMGARRQFSAGSEEAWPTALYEKSPEQEPAKAPRKPKATVEQRVDSKKYVAQMGQLGLSKPPPTLARTILTYFPADEVPYSTNGLRSVMS
ncbi:unnamed protein product [Nezara viridula]|uniref:Uncharacterized protein n=1 Tax=Nezara viridula TaxID=85310 RepID=A0A9P0HAL4_NEZVI|nr:unnamed protein product [Nezara viridula]